MWKNTVERGRPQVTIWRMRIACWITKATNTHSDYVLLIAIPLQQQLHERASMSRYTYIVCLIYIFWYIRPNKVCFAQPNHVAAFGFAVIKLFVDRLRHYCCVCYRHNGDVTPWDSCFPVISLLLSEHDDTNNQIQSQGSLRNCKERFWKNVPIPNGIRVTKPVLSFMAVILQKRFAKCSSHFVGLSSNADPKLEQIWPLSNTCMWSCSAGR
jgi:hypothetical protein